MNYDCNCAEKSFYNLKQGLSNKDIANDICLSENTVKSHLQQLFIKLDVNNRSQVVMKIMRL
ncbi:MAG: LuxR C-terminal-related transcriptional regulator [Cryomorphaceae bacterium]|nr:LuxR C-terminal-related transcriptional regulator [Cryomorphaceae bacterium]